MPIHRTDGIITVSFSSTMHKTLGGGHDSDRLPVGLLASMGLLFGPKRPRATCTCSCLVCHKVFLVYHNGVDSCFLGGCHMLSGLHSPSSFHGVLQQTAWQGRLDFCTLNTGKSNTCHTKSHLELDDSRQCQAAAYFGNETHTNVGDV